MQDLKRTIGSAVLAVAAGAAKPLLAGGFYHAPPAAYASSSWGGYYHADPQPGYPDWQFSLGNMFERMRKAPLEHKAYNPGDLRKRQVCNPYCPPFWGYSEPRWRQLASPVGSRAGWSGDPTLAPTPPAPNGPLGLVPPPAPADPQIPPAPPSAPPPAPVEVPDGPVKFLDPPPATTNAPVIVPGPSLSSNDDGWSARRSRD